MGAGDSGSATPLKRACHFRLCTTSFIYPADWVTNARRLANHVDEVELLFLESAREDSLPNRRQIRELGRIGADRDLTYNVHLPGDVFPGHPERRYRQSAVDRLSAVIDLAMPLHPSTMTLHLPFTENTDDPTAIDTWRERTHQTVRRLLDNGYPPAGFSIESLDYPFDWVVPVITECHLRVCLDLGHLWVHGHDVRATFDRFASRTDILHIHGVDGRRDHLGLQRLPIGDQQVLADILAVFSGTVSIEVFNTDDFHSSLAVLGRLIHRLGHRNG